MARKINTGNEFMKIEDFGRLLAEEVRNLMGGGYDVQYQEVLKNNGVVYHALTVRKTERFVAPTIYFDELYQQYRQGAMILDIAKEMVNTYNRFMPSRDENMDFFEDFSKVCRKLFFKVVNFKKNKKKLEDVPYRRLMDMAMVPLCRVESDLLGEGVITIQKSHLKEWEISEDELWENISEYAAKTAPPKVEGLMDMLEHITGAEAEAGDMCGIYVVSNTNGCLGASAAFYPGVLKGISEDFESDLFIVPSSIHEVLVIPDPSLEMDTASLREIIHEVNSTTVSEEEVLSDNLYRYDLETDKVFMVKEA